MMRLECEYAPVAGSDEYDTFVKEIVIENDQYLDSATVNVYTQVRKTQSGMRYIMYGHTVSPNSFLHLPLELTLWRGDFLYVEVLSGEVKVSVRLR